MHLHLDPVGGIAGDMFVAAVLDLTPEWAEPMIEAVRGAGLHEGLTMRHERCSDGVLTGSGFDVRVAGESASHAHVDWRTLRGRIVATSLDAAVQQRTIDIFALLAAAEARVHGLPVEQVSFHEVGAWDSIADIVSAAWLIERLGACTWSVGTIPIGAGRVKTAHGLLPVPAPATALLLEGFACIDDGLVGERVTPTGAAILKHLQPQQGLGRSPRRLVGSAHGFGTKRFPGISNVLRLLAFEMTMDGNSVQIDQVAELSFEIDDQTPEDLAQGLQRLRETEGVVDVIQYPVTAKKNRLAMGVRVLAWPDRAEAVAQACFAETTTLGLRLQVLERRVLPRVEAVSADGVRVKLVQRPTGLSAKADSDDLRQAEGQLARAVLRARAEDEVKSNDQG